MTQTWRQVGPAHAFADARAAVALGERIYVAGGDGRLRAVDVASGTIEELGEPRWQTRLLAAAGGRLYAVEEDGRLYAIETDGRWRQLDGDWSEARALVGSDRLYVAAHELWAVDCVEGTWQQVGRDRWTTELLLAAGDGLYALEEDGSLYHIDREHGAWRQLDGDWGDVGAGVGVGDRLFLMASTGALYAVAADGSYEPVDTGSSWDTRILMAAGQSLVALEHDGSLYAISL
jgi:outer membrane protein assembly factor BamB